MYIYIYISFVLTVLIAHDYIHAYYDRCLYIYIYIHTQNETQDKANIFFCSVSISTKADNSDSELPRFWSSRSKTRQCALVRLSQTSAVWHVASQEMLETSIEMSLIFILTKYLGFLGFSHAFSTLFHRISTQQFLSNQSISSHPRFVAENCQGVNHGSLSERILFQYGDSCGTPAMLASVAMGLVQDFCLSSYPLVN